MQDTLIFILKNIVTAPDDVKVEETVDETGTTNYVISVNPTDVGRIIGKEGKIIKAIRTIMRVIAIQKGLHVRVSVLSENDGVEETEAPLENQAVEESTVESGSDESLSVEV